jgi:hypothetical protein
MDTPIKNEGPRDVNMPRVRTGTGLMSRKESEKVMSPLMNKFDVSYS